jgi:hypothetical protein
MISEKEKIEAEKEELLESILVNIEKLQDIYERIKKIKLKDLSDITYLDGYIDAIYDAINGIKEFLEFLQELDE